MPNLNLTEFADNLNRIFPEVMRELSRRQTKKTSIGKISAPQCMIINSLDHAVESRMTDIAGLLGVTTAAATGLVDRLVKGGYIQRVDDPGDRRIVRVKLTPRGREAAKNIKQNKRQAIMEVFGQLSENERRIYLSTLEKVRNILMNNQQE